MVAKKSTFSVLLLLGFCVAGCPTRTVYDDGGDEGSSGGSGGQGGRVGSGGATNSGGHLGTGGASLTGAGGGGGAVVSGAGGFSATGGSVAIGGMIGTGAGGTAGSGTTGGRGGGATGGMSTGGDTGTGGARGGTTGTGGTGMAGRGGSGGGTGGAFAGHGGTVGTGGNVGTGGSMGTGGAGVVTCGAGLTNCSGTCVNLQTDVNHCGSCTAQACGGTCQSGLCCTGGKTNCGGTCVDLSSDDKHCGGCTGSTTDCTMMGRALYHCRAGMCRLADGNACAGDSDCYSGKCDTFYGDSDKDGYPNMRDAARFCTFPANSSSENDPSTPNYISPRADAKWDCCDEIASVHPGATQFVAWGSFSTFDPQCMGSAGDTNCDGTVEVDPTAVITSSCNLQGDGTCDVVKQTPTSADCGTPLCGCGAPAANAECQLYCPPSGAAVGCR